jgi:CRP/FNR family transcriptional regulator, cyclic AMP receptor protein
MMHKLLNGISPAEAAQLLALGSRVRVSSGDFLFRLGDPAEHLYLIERGQIRLSFPMLFRGHEEDVFFEEKGPGDTVGWSAMVPPYRHSIQN